MVLTKEQALSNLIGIKKIDFITFWVSNAKMCASYFAHAFRFVPIAYKGLETGSRETCSWVIRLNGIKFVFTSPYEYGSGEVWGNLSEKGDMIKDIALQVDDLDACMALIRDSGITITKDVWTESDRDGVVRFAQVKIVGVVTHTLVERHRYRGNFLPNFASPMEDWKLANTGPDVPLLFIDHFVPVVNEGNTEETTNKYLNGFGLEPFIPSDDLNVSTATSGLKMVVVANKSKDVIINIIEPRKIDRVSQLREFLHYNSGEGIQHFALRTDNIVQVVSSLKDRGVEFLDIPESYYKRLRQRLEGSKLKVKESLDDLERLNILLDFNEDGYLLQLFTKPLFDRPTTYLEIIQRNNHSGFGAGNVKALYEAVERLQRQRGNLE